MSMRDQYGNELLEPSHRREKHAYEDVWAVYKVQDGFHSGQCLTSYMTLALATEEAGKRNQEIGTGAGYSFKAYRPYRKAKRRTPQKPGPRKW